MTVFNICRGAVCGAISALAMLFPVSSSLADDAPTPVKGVKLVPPDYVFNSNVPSDVVTFGLGLSGLQPFVDNLAWNTFIAVNWPAPQSGSLHGVPDRQNVIGGLKSGGDGKPGIGGKGVVMPTGPVVWETFKSTDDIFMNPPVKPTPFDAAPVVPAACKALAKKDPAAALHVLTETEQAFSGKPLIDQNGQKVWYEVKVNRAYYDYVVNNGFYNSKNQEGKTISFPIAGNTNLQPPVVKVKAAWKILGKDDVAAQFYAVNALIYDHEAKTCTDQKVGLVGLHVVQKTQQFQQWAWATFEHVNNAPDQSGPVAGAHYNFFNPQCPAAQCPPNTFPVKPGQDGPTQVVRLVPIDSSAAQVNAPFQDALRGLRADNVWQYYMLVDSQWGPLNPPDIGTPTQPEYLANTTMETYLQAPQPAPGSPHGCINCHGEFGKTTDLDFQITKAYPHKKQTEELLKSFMH